MNFFKDLNQKALSSFSRFPITLTWVIIGSFYLIGVYSFDDLEKINNITEIQLTLVLGVSWLIAAQFVSEALNHTKIYRFLLKLVILIALAVFYFYTTDNEGFLGMVVYGQFYLLLLAGHVFIVFAPFLVTWDKNRFWDYLKSIIHAVLRSTLYAVILYLGLAIAVSALEILFKIEFNANIYLQIFIFCLGIVNTFVYLSDFPKLSDLKNEVKLSKAGEVLILYILMPLSLLYLLIVYLYAFKILIEWELPEGFVTYLISALSLLAFVIHIAIEPVRKTNKFKLIKLFYPYYFYAILPLLPLLFIALYRRIADYNFTELRYLGLVLAIWISGMLIYMVVSNQKALSLYAKSMFVLLLICTFGPLSAFKISVNAQVNELGELMRKADEQSEKQFTELEYDRFESIIKYLSNREALHRTKEFFGFNPDSLFSETSSYKKPKKIVDKLGINIIASKETNSTKKGSSKKYKSRSTKSYYMSSFKANYAEDISDFNNYTELDLQNNRDENTALLLHYNDKNIISFRYYDEILFETDMTTHFVNIADKYDYLNQANQSEFTFRFKNKKGDYLMIFDKLKYSYDKGQVNIISGRAKMFYRTYQNLELP